MDDGADEELQRLRARAYGPDADIDGDPEALARLAELEARRQAAETPAPADEPETSPPPAGSLLGTPADASADASGQTSGLTSADTSDETPSDTADTPADAALPSRGQRWKRRAGWAASIAATVLITAAATTAVTFPLTPLSPVPRDIDVQQVATLLVDEDFAIPRGFGDDLGQSYGFEPFAGLRAITIERGWANPGTDGCLIVVSERMGEDSQEYIEGPLYFGCAAGPFPAAVNLSVTPDAPPGLREAYPEGTSLQFLHDGSRVAVFVTG